jgi:hypothetical protein
MAKHKYLSNLDGFSLRFKALFGLLDCDCIETFTWSSFLKSCSQILIQDFQMAKIKLYFQKLLKCFFNVLKKNPHFHIY